MLYILYAIAMILAVLPASSVNASVSVGIGQPGFYGRIDIGSAPPPLLIYPEPIVIQPVPRSAPLPPLYLHVPPGHAKHWHKHCSRYNACGHPVYFVQEHWYNDVYVPHYRKRSHYYERDDDKRGHYHKRVYHRERDDDDDDERGHYRNKHHGHKHDYHKHGNQHGKHHGKGHGEGHKGHGRGHGKD